MSFSNKVVIVTGASSGIGAATAILFAQEGANVAMVGRNETRLKNVADKVAKAGKKPLVIKADVAKDEDAKRIVEETVTKFGRIDVLVNNAGLVRYGTLLDGKIVEAYDEILNINLRGLINLTTFATPNIVKTKGNIINISSVSGIGVPLTPTFLPYHISKAGLDMFTRGAALELAPSGVRVNSVNPGPVKTDILDSPDESYDWNKLAEKTALGRVSDPNEIADLILFVASEKARGVTGSIYVNDNGYLLK